MMQAQLEDLGPILKARRDGVELRDGFAEHDELRITAGGLHVPVEFHACFSSMTLATVVARLSQNAALGALWCAADSAPARAVARALPDAVQITAACSQSARRWSYRPRLAGAFRAETSSRPSAETSDRNRPRRFH